MTGDESQDRLRALSETFRAFAECTTDVKHLLETVARKLTELIGDACVVSLADDRGGWSEPNAAFARDPAATAVLRDALGRFAERDGTGPGGHVVRTGRSVLLPVLDPDELARSVEPSFAGVVRQLGIRSYLSVPLEVGGRRLGALSLSRYLPGSPAFGEDDLAFALSISDHAALAIANAQLFESLQGELRERERAEERAKTFVALVENSNDMIAMADFSGRVLFMNAAGRALVGLAPDRDVREMTLGDFHAADDLDRVQAMRQRERARSEGTIRHQQTGELIAMQVSSFLVRDAAGQPLCYATVEHDLRETKRLESDLRQAQKMDALGRLAGGVAHDFNNLLTVILSYSAMLLKALPPDGDHARDVEQIDRAAQRAAELTHQLLAFSRRQVLKPEPIDLGPTLRAMEDMIRRLIGEDIELRIITAAEPGAVMVDAGQAEQVVMNLVVNARDAMPGGGVLTLETARADVADRSLGIDPGRYHTLSITDTGTGIDAQTRAHLFEPFFTTKDLGKGTGLGLSTVMGIVEQSGGHITVDSVVGRGTTFCVYLPAITHVAAPALALPRTYTPLSDIQRILVVEDEVEVRILICDVLRKAGYDVIDANDGEHALHVAAAIPGEIHLLLTDVIMPRLSGRQLAIRFLEQRPATRVLYMSGYAEDKLGQHGVLDPDVELVTKPLTPAILLDRVRAVLKADSGR